MIRIIIAILLLATTTSAKAQEAATDYSGSLILKIVDLPQFADYPPEEGYLNERASDIDWSSSKSARTFKTRLREGLKNGPNFNGHYIIVTYGCGTACQGNQIIDARNGKVVGEFTTSYGVAFRNDSSLIIADWPGTEPNLKDDYSMLYEIRFSRVENDKLIPIRTIKIRGK